MSDPRSDKNSITQRLHWYGNRTVSHSAALLIVEMVSVPVRSECNDRPFGGDLYTLCLGPQALRPIEVR